MPLMWQDDPGDEVRGPEAGKAVIIETVGVFNEQFRDTMSKFCSLLFLDLRRNSVTVCAWFFSFFRPAA